MSARDNFREIRGIAFGALLGAALLVFAFAMVRLLAVLVTP